MRNNVTPKLKTFAQQLLAYEAEAGQSAGGGGSAAFRVFEKLRQPLGKLMGTGGFHALFSRALTLASAEVTWLSALKIQPDGSLQGLAELEAKLRSDEIALGEAVLVSQLLGLLVTFIGSALTLRLLHDVWPDIDDVGF